MIRSFQDQTPIVDASAYVDLSATDEEVAEIRWYWDNYVKYRLDYIS